jgi:dihydroorotase
VHTLCIDGPVYDQVATISQFLHLGLDLPQIVAATPFHPARALRRPELDTLKIGRVGEASVLGVKTGSFANGQGLAEAREKMALDADNRCLSYGAIFRWFLQRCGSRGVALRLPGTVSDL